MPLRTSVAIVGIGAIFPDAPDPGTFWDNIRSGRSAARDVPAGRWLIPADAAYDPTVGLADRVYSRKGCFIDRLPPLSELSGLAVDPAVVAGLDPLFHLLLHAGSRAFSDGVTTPLDRSRVGVIIGNLALPTEGSARLSRQWLGATFTEKLLGRPAAPTDTLPLNRYVAGLPAGILAQALGLGATRCTLDAACASSLYAIKLACDELLAGRADAMLTGGVSRPDPLYTQMGFSQLRALSKRGICAPFDASGDGLVVGEGAGIFLLKRTADAVAHGDRIYGIIRGVGLSNDVGGSLLAPLSEGQLRAMRSAYGHAGWHPGDVDLIECHATGTPVGDATEVASLRQLWENEPTDARCVIGSVKSNVGHLLTAAGGAALTKVLLSLQEATLPPTANFAAPQPGMGLSESPFRVLTAPEPWQRRGDAIPRRAAVSAFGFGGINAHLLVEEWLPESATLFPSQSLPPLQGEGTTSASDCIGSANEPIAVVGMDARFGPWQSLQAFQERALGGDGATEPTKPNGWWGAEDAAWFRREGYDRFPFAGYYLDRVELQADQFRIPPLELQEMLPQQLLMLQAAAAAMADAGLDREGNQRTGVFVGIALDLNSTNFSFRWSLAEAAPALAKELGSTLSPDEMAAWTARLRDAAGPPLTANRTMGALGSIVASRIAREFRIGGPSFTLSSEESSGIRSLETAVRLLRNNEIDRALVGAVDLAGDLRAVLGQHGNRPYSAKGTSLPFDAQADGTVVGEGAAAVVLKRLDDAVRNGDQIYAVIRGIGTAGGDTVVPDTAAYRQALDRAYADAGIAPATVGYLEAHASGDPAEDRLEAATLASFFDKQEMRRRSCAVSGAKGDIGHSGAASGLASLVRACLALHHEIIPPCRGNRDPLPELSGSGPLFLPPTPRYWLRNRSDGPRRAGVSVIGVDGSCGHAVLEGWDGAAGQDGPERLTTIRTSDEQLFAVTGATTSELKLKLEELKRNSLKNHNTTLFDLAREWYSSAPPMHRLPLALTLVARHRDELASLIELGQQTLDGREPQVHPNLRDRLFYSASPLGSQGSIAFVFPGSGNHFPGMGMELSARWPALLRGQDSENLHLRDQFQPELFWNGAGQAELDSDHRAVIFGQVATGCAVSDLVRSFGIEPRSAIGYSLGESAALFSQRAWRDRDGMLARMQESTLFTRDLAGECRAARRAWQLPEGAEVSWSLGVVDAPAGTVRRLLAEVPRVYLLIVNTPDECVVGGDTAAVERLVSLLGCRFFPLHGVTTVHCEVAREVAEPYRSLHLFSTDPPAGVTFYSGAKGGSYPVDRESTADAILAQALKGIDFPAVIESAYSAGVRYFLEMGPGNSCSRMIGRILEGRPHLARSACFPGQEPTSILLRLLANLIAEGIPVNLAPLYAVPAEAVAQPAGSPSIGIATGGEPFSPPLPEKGTVPPLQSVAVPRDGERSSTVPRPHGALPHLQPADGLSLETVIREFAAAQEAQLKAHETFLRFSEGLSRTVAETAALQAELLAALGGELPPDLAAPAIPPVATPRRECAFDRDLCLEFARGSVARMLGPAFADADTFPTRVRLPDEPLMLVDRIVALEGEAKSMSHGRVVTEHDVLAGAWYLDGGRIPTCIAVEAGQADLFLSGYLGIDFITRGLAVYRLLDAKVTFHRGLPEPGETIHYDIRIERFFRQGNTWLFRFFYDATVNGEPLLTMRDGCAGFFSEEELAAGKGIVRPAIDLRPTAGKRPDDWQDLVPMARESYDATQLDRLRSGDLAGCFGSPFEGLSIARPLTIPGDRMRLVHRVTGLDPTGGRYGLGIIRAEADIRPDDWFLTCHFVDDRVMPGTLMYECCLHTLRIFLLRMGWVAEAGCAAWEPVPGVTSGLRCRGQVLETTRVAGYEVTIRELGYRPEPYAVVDALMYADGKPIVEITSMSVRLTGTTKEQLLSLWSGQTTASPLRPETGRKPAVYTKEQILAYSNGNPSDGFGEPYRIFDHERKIARLPGPPFQFMDRVTGIKGEPWQMLPGAMAEAQYDVPPDAWYFVADRQGRMPFSVLLEAALQPCGWLAAYVGSALTSPSDLSFRNLGGTAVQHRPVTPESGTLTAVATLTKAATSGGMIIQEFDFSVADRFGILYEGETMFGFFAKEALANQVGIRDASPWRPTEEEITKGRSLPYPEATPFPDRQLRMIDRIDLFVADGGPAGLGYLRGIKEVDPEEWFFKAHFYQDPVTPGSLGLESFLQLLKVTAVERWGWREGDTIAAVACERRHRWLYRGQIVPANRQVTVEAWITAVDDSSRTLTADGLLSVDGRPIYQMHDFTLRMEP